MQTGVNSAIAGAGNGFTVTGFSAAAAEQVVAVIVSVTFTLPAPAVFQVTVIWFVPAPAVIVPPVTDHAYVWPATAGVLYIDPVVPSHAAAAPVITGAGNGFTVTDFSAAAAEHVVAVIVSVTLTLPAPTVFQVTVI